MERPDDAKNDDNPTPIYLEDENFVHVHHEETVIEDIIYLPEELVEKVEPDSAQGPPDIENPRVSDALDFNQPKAHGSKDPCPQVFKSLNATPAFITNFQEDAQVQSLDAQRYWRRPTFESNIVYDAEPEQRPHQNVMPEPAYFEGNELMRYYNFDPTFIGPPEFAAAATLQFLASGQGRRPAITAAASPQLITPPISRVYRPRKLPNILCRRIPRKPISGVIDLSRSGSQRPINLTQPIQPLAAPVFSPNLWMPYLPSDPPQTEALCLVKEKKPKRKQSRKDDKDQKKKRDT